MKRENDTVSCEDSELQVLIESYKSADAQLQMRIQQRDNFAIQLMISVGALLGFAFTSSVIIIRQLCIISIPFLCTYFCEQIFSSYEVHHRLAYFMKNILEENISLRTSKNVILWENFCEYDRSMIKKSKIGGRESFFKGLNIIIPIVCLVINFAFVLNSTYNIINAERTNVLYQLLMYMMIIPSILAIWWSLAINNKHRKIGYEAFMNDKLAKRGYINKQRLDLCQRNKAVFLDRDGTIIIDKVETRKVEDLEFVKDIDSLIDLIEADYLLVIVTNQSGIGKGNYTEKEMMTFNEFMLDRLKDRGITIDALYYCPHTQSDNCQCKKPKDGMLRRAAMELHIDLSKSMIIGDQNTDIMAGLNAGLRKCIAVPTGLYPHSIDGCYHKNPHIEKETIFCENLQKAVEEILKDDFVEKY